MITCEQCLKPCPEHNILACATCHKHRHECDFGACTEHANVYVNFHHHKNFTERREMCEYHADFAVRTMGYTKQ